MATISQANDSEDSNNNMNIPPQIRPQATHEANRLHSAFFGHPLPSSSNDNDTITINASPTKRTKLTPKNERLCMGGHRATIFGLSFSPDGKYIASASEDSTICIWDVKSHRLITTLKEGIDDKYECLRVAWMNTNTNITINNDDGTAGCEEGEKYVLASAGADGVVRLWSGCCETQGGKLSWHSVGTIDHYLLQKEGSNDNDQIDDAAAVGEGDDRPQIYAMQFVHNQSAKDLNLLLTSANDTIYLWNIVEQEKSHANNDSQIIKQRTILPYTSVQFSHLHNQQQHQVNQFGGERNPDNELYVFDASYSQSKDLIGVALSDGTCRVLSLVANGKNNNNNNADRNHHRAYCKEQCVLSLPNGYFPGNRGGHLTALSWDKSGSRLATCIASGRVVLWSLQVVNGVYGAMQRQVLHPSCVSVLEGGHDAGRPLFGAKYCGGQNEELLLTWGVDGKVCVWDSYSVEEVYSPLFTLVSHSNYPIYSLDITETRSSDEQADDGANKLRVALGGGTEGGFLGMPLYVYDV